MTGTSSTGHPKANIVAAFTKVYDENVWQRKDTSGPGSSVQHTGDYRSFLHRLLQSRQVKRLLDVGCGLWEYMQHVNLAGIDYLGIDPVVSVIKRNKALNLPPNIQFQCGVIDDVPDLASYDMAIVKDVFQHLPNQLIIEMLEKLKVIPVLVVTNDLLKGPNINCDLGGFRKINLEAPPFSVVPAGKMDFPSVPFVKRTLVIQNDVNASAQGSSTS
ncbi:class I SAM-dependent methyltransferase [Candidatus Dependentiae bacterium]|jgi:SAM-dependent methyltransferase|nr:MAG: class I SAM-dependent methyltransferase [Candidatus Dependentiae bacterium]